MTTTARDSPLINRLRMGKWSGSGGDPGGYSLTTSPLMRSCSQRRCAPAGKLDPAPDSRTAILRVPLSSARTMRGRVDAAGETADDRNAAAPSPSASREPSRWRQMKRPATRRSRRRLLEADKRPAYHNTGGRSVSVARASRHQRSRSRQAHRCPRAPARRRIGPSPLHEWRGERQ